MLETSAGYFASDDDGERWHAIDLRLPRTRAPLGYIGEIRSFHPGVAVATGRDGQLLLRTNERRKDQLHGFGATGGCKGGQNSPCTGQLLVTNNGGRSWRGTDLDVPAASAQGSSRLWAVPGWGYAIPEQWAVSTSGGRRWRVIRVPRGSICSAAAQPTSTLWMGCSLSTKDFGSKTVLFRSDDGGRSWTRLLAPSWAPAAVHAVSPHEAWAAPGFGDNLGLLWHTRDGGRTWVAEWPDLPTPR